MGGPDPDLTVRQSFTPVECQSYIRAQKISASDPAIEPGSPSQITALTIASDQLDRPRVSDDNSKVRDSNLKLPRLCRVVALTMAALLPAMKGIRA